MNDLEHRLEQLLPAEAGRPPAAFLEAVQYRRNRSRFLWSTSAALALVMAGSLLLSLWPSGSSLPPSPQTVARAELGFDSEQLPPHVTMLTRSTERLDARPGFRLSGPVPVSGMAYEPEMLSSWVD